MTGRRPNKELEKALGVAERKILRLKQASAKDNDRYHEQIEKAKNATKVANAEKNEARWANMILWRFWDRTANVLSDADAELHRWYSTANVMRGDYPGVFTSRGFGRTARIRMRVRHITAKSKEMRQADNAEQLAELLAEPDPDATLAEVV